MMLQVMYQTGGTPSKIDKKEETATDDDDQKESSEDDDDDDDPWVELDVEFEEQILDPLIQEKELGKILYPVWKQKTFATFF